MVTGVIVRRNTEKTRVGRTTLSGQGALLQAPLTKTDWLLLQTEICLVHRAVDESHDEYVATGRWGFRRLPVVNELIIRRIVTEHRTARRALRKSFTTVRVTVVALDFIVAETGYSCQVTEIAAAIIGKLPLDRIGSASLTGV